MKIYNSELWISDLDRAVERLPELKEMEGRSVLITGAGGLICSAVTDVLIRYNETHEGKIRILAAGRNPEKLHRRFSPFDGRPYFACVSYDATKVGLGLMGKCDYIIHGAGNATPAKTAGEPVETMLGSFVGMKSLLDYAKAYQTRRVLVISSSEIYGRKADSRPYREDDYGCVDILNPRNAYPTGKRAAEALCAAYGSEYGVDSVIVRPGHIYGPTASPEDDRVASAWAYAAARGEDIVMKSDGAQVRSYCYCLDCASAIWKVLLRGTRGLAYNISNPNSIVSVGEVGQLLAGLGGGKLLRQAPSDAERRRFNPMDNSSLDSSRLEALGWEGVFDAETGFAHTVAILRNRISETEPEGGAEP